MMGINFNLLKTIKDSAGTPSQAAISDAVTAYLGAHPVTISSLEATKVTTDTTHRFITDAQLNTFVGKTDLATVKADTDISGAISATHSHANKTSLDNYNPAIFATTGHNHTGVYEASFTRLTVSGDKATGSNTTPVTMGISFDYAANSTYIIDMYLMVAPTAATTGCTVIIDTSTTATYVGTFGVHQLATSGTLSGFSSIGDAGATSKGVSSGMVGTGSNFVSGSGMLITNANSGTATFYFQSETTAVTTLKSGSVIRIMKI